MRQRFLLAGMTLMGMCLPALPGRALDEAIGQALFQRAWVPAPSSTKANDGLGPLFNARSCASCHHDLGRARVKTDARGIVQSDHLILRFSDAAGAPDPVYGHQLQTSSVTGTEPEGRIARHSDHYAAADLQYGPLADRTRTGALLAPALRGLGLLESVPDDTIAARAGGRGPDGVAGRVHWVMDADGHRRAGRFGWKASQATLTGQTENAFLLDIGLSTSGHPFPAGDCTLAQQACLMAPHGGSGTPVEISDDIVSRVVAYLTTIAPNEPGPVDARGERLFIASGCAACHKPSLPGAHGPVRAFTDLLLHDMGPGLDGGATEPGVASTEWRTAPLWGLSRTLAEGSGLLHDGRASSIAGAIHLHGGEAASSRTRFEALTSAERRKLVDYLKTL